MKSSRPIHSSIVQETNEEWRSRFRPPLGQAELALRWLQSNLQQIGFWGFSASVVWAIAWAIGLNVGYQDSWILERVWQPLLVALVFYVITVYKDLDPGHTAVLTSIFVFAIYAVSTLKYTFIYASTIDASVHFSMMRTLAETGRPDVNAYAFTPGLHILVASLAQLSGTSLTFWAKIVPAFMGSMIPLGIYLLCNRAKMPRLLLRCIVILSGLSLPMLYLPNGTTFAVLISGPLLSMVILQSNSLPQMRLGFTFMVVLLGSTLVIWHAISSVLVPLVFAVSGAVALVFAWAWQRLSYRQEWIHRAGVALLVTGVLGFIATLVYWRFVATPIWEQLMSNIRIFTQVIETQEPSEGILIPERTFSLNTADLFVALLINHARDAGMLALVALGGIINLYALFRSWRTRDSEESYPQIIRLFIIVCAVFCLILITTLVTGFAKHGYKRYLLYVMSVSAPIAGLGLWHMVRFIHDRSNKISTHSVMAPFVLFAFLIAAIQLVPYQPMVPRARMFGTDGTTPLFWQHQANSEYQYFGIKFAYDQVDEDFNIFVDYRTFQQSGIFIDLSAKRHFHYGSWPEPRPAYVLYHVPGRAGAYGEQAEYRSVEAITARRELDGVHTVYDNGGTFLMFVPERQIEEMYLGFTGDE